MHVCAAKLLVVNLDDSTWTRQNVTEQTIRTYLLGSGQAARMYMDLPSLPAPLEPAAPLYVMTGLLTGTMTPCACRVLLCGRSPLTGIWNESTAGGFFGAELRAAGWDGIVITGRAASPSVLWVHDDSVQLIPTPELWGQETTDSAAAVRAMTDPRAQVAAIGPAGERLIPMASVMLGGEDSRAAGRGGMGAVMGSKNLKAIAVRGHTRPTYADTESFRIQTRKSNADLKNVYVGMTKLGTGGSLENAARAGDMPVRNWSGGAWAEGAHAITGATSAERGLIVRNYHCHACPVGCTQHVRIPSGPYAGLEGHAPEYETLAGFGGNCGNPDLDAIITLNERCNRLGLDTISASAAIAFAFEAAERGLIHDSLAGALELRWGDAKTMLALVDQIAAGEGLGLLLGQGVRATARELGAGSEAYAVHVKGLEVPYHDPRAEPSMAANYATAARGACHLAALSYSVMWGYRSGGVYIPDPYVQHSSLGKGRMAAEWQNWMTAMNALGLCKLAGKTYIVAAWAAGFLQAGLGWDTDEAELLRAGERIFNLQRLINFRLGVTGADDRLPDRLTREARPDGGSAGVLPDMELMMCEYHDVRGWDADGRPTPEKLAELGL
jgi:aldehyde:ferredoxin oxidoreductase